MHLFFIFKCHYNLNLQGYPISAISEPISKLNSDKNIAPNKSTSEMSSSCRQSAQSSENNTTNTIQSVSFILNNYVFHVNTNYIWNNSLCLSSAYFKISAAATHRYFNLQVILIYILVRETTYT